MEEAYDRVNRRYYWYGTCNTIIDILFRRRVSREYRKTLHRNT